MSKMVTETHLQIGITGLAELKEKLEALPAELLRKVHRSAMKKALKPTLDAVLRNVPVGDTGNLKAGVKVRSKVVYSRSKGKSYMYGGVFAMAPHAHLVEYGHRLVTGGSLPGKKAKDPSRSGKGQVVGHVAPHPYMLPALLESGEAVVEGIADELAEALKKCEVSK